MKMRLTNGGFTILDEADHKRFRRWNWQRHSKGYVSRCQSNGRAGTSQTFYLHREILGAPKGVQIDHINGNRLDNRRSNLRFANQFLNNGNMKMQERPKSAPFKGVSLRKDTGKWAAYIKHAGRKITLGCFATPEEAAVAYNAAAQAQWGEFAHPNVV